MKTKSSFAKIANPNTVAVRLRTGCVARLVVLLLLALPAAAQAQFTYTTNNGAITITGYTSPGGDVTIPDTHNGLPVTSIGDEAFENCTSLTNITIGNSVTSIGYAAFAACLSLTNATIGNSVTSIGDHAFHSCISLASITIPNNVTYIGGYAFRWCINLTSVTIPDSVTYIGDEAFAVCSSLTNITIGNNVINIGESTFSRCTNLTGVYFKGNAPRPDFPNFPVFDPKPPTNATVYYLPGTTGWGSTFGGRPTALWSLPYPLILNYEPSFGVRTNQFGFIISWATNISVVVEGCTDLANPTWSPVRTNTLTGGWCYFSDPQWTNYPTRFYRLRSP